MQKKGNNIIKNIEVIIESFYFQHGEFKKSLKQYLQKIDLNEDSLILKLIFVNDDLLNNQDLENFKSLIDRCRSTIKNSITNLSSVEVLLAIDSSQQSDLLKQNSKVPTNEQSNKNNTRTKIKLDNVNKIITVISGKGGVGKSTLASNLALTLSSLGFKVGLLDADIYGPSIPRMFNLNKSDNEPKIKDGYFVPLEKYNIQLMSVGFLIEENIATVWRGPMITKMIHKLLSNTRWGQYGMLRNKKLDFLIIDTPPGTGDIHLSLAENYNIDGAIAISIPTDIAVSDTHKSIDMLNKLQIPLIGIVSNMSYLRIESNEAKQFNLYGTDIGLVKKYAEKNNINFISSIPLEPSLSVLADNGSSMYNSKAQNLNIIKKEFLNITNFINDYFKV